MFRLYIWLVRSVSDTVKSSAQTIKMVFLYVFDVQLKQIKSDC